jgi:hypothetical protein
MSPVGNASKVKSGNAAAAAAPTGQLIYTGPVTLRGFSCDETTGAATAKFVIRDGVDATGAARVFVTLGANESDRDWFGEGGIRMDNGIYIDRTQGTTELVVQYSELTAFT